MKSLSLSTMQVARLMGVSDQSVSNWVDSGKLRAGKTPGGHRRVEKSDLITFLNQQNFRIPRELLPPGTTILVVDNEPDVGRWLKKSLKTKHPNWNIVVALDGFAAGESVATDHPNIVLLNLQMPGLDGLDVCRRIKSNRHARHAEVIAITARHSAENQKAAMEAGAAAYLPKPMDFEPLYRIIQDLLPTR